MVAQISDPRQRLAGQMDLTVPLGKLSDQRIPQRDREAMPAAEDLVDAGPGPTLAPPRKVTGGEAKQVAEGVKAPAVRVGLDEVLEDLAEHAGIFSQASLR